MGGQQFCAGGLLLDTRGASRVLGLDAERGTIEVEAGIQWPELYSYLKAPENGGGAWAFAQKQTGADRLTLGGAISANVHGRALTLAPIVAVRAQRHDQIVAVLAFDLRHHHPGDFGFRAMTALASVGEILDQRLSFFQRS